MKIVLRVVGPLFVAVGLFWFAQGTGLLTWQHNAAMVDYGAGNQAKPCLANQASAAEQTIEIKAVQKKGRPRAALIERRYR
jgi:hypothetical protein